MPPILLELKRRRRHGSELPAGLCLALSTVGAPRARPPLSWRARSGSGPPSLAPCFGVQLFVEFVQPCQHIGIRGRDVFRWYVAGDFQRI